MLSLETVFIVAGIIFAIGLLGILTRRNLVIVIMSLELMFNAVVLAALGATRFTVPFSLLNGTGTEQALTGHILSIIVITVAAVETGLFLALVFAFYNRFKTAELDQASDLKG